MGTRRGRPGEDRPPRLHEEGRLELDRLITARYSLAELTEGYRAQAAGETVRGLLVHV